MAAEQLAHDLSLAEENLGLLESDNEQLTQKITELNELRLSAALNHDTVVDMLHTQYQEKIQTLELEVEKWKLATQKNADCIRSLTKQCAELVQEKHDLLYKRAN